MARTSERGRDAGTGRFIPVKEAERRKEEAVVEKIKVGPIKHRK
jgi:desulfoferrodoxin (superoxide reductase-like protein)